MSYEKFHSSHLSYEPYRRERFRAVRNSIIDSKGAVTVLLQGMMIEDDLGELDFRSSSCSRFRNLAATQSDYLLQVATQTYRLKYGNNRIGRFDDNDVVIDEIYVSRRHCCIVIHSDGKAELFDTASKNHTYVNGVQIERCWLKSGDEIRLGRHFPLIISLVNS